MNFKKTITSLSLFIFFVLVSFQSSAVEKGLPLYFPAKQNNIQTLPQKFEYSLRDAYRFLLGNRIIDTSHFEFQIRPGANSMQVDLRWPENIFEKGTISILSPSGVSVWSSVLKENQNFSSSRSL